MRRSALTLLPLLFVAAGLSSCGGGGGDPDPGDNGNNPDLSELASVRTEATLVSSGGSIDSTNLFVGERVQFRLTGIPTSGVRQYVNVRGWTTTVPANVGTITSDGLFTAGSATGTGVVQVTIDNFTYSATVTVKGGGDLALLTGRVRLTNGTAAYGVGLQVLNASGGVVATGRSATDGTFRIGTPNSAARLNLDFAAIDPNATFYVRQFAFSETDYSTEISGCTAPLPAVTNGATTALADVVVYLLSTGSTPPPPPDGCGNL